MGYTGPKGGAAMLDLDRIGKYREDDRLEAKLVHLLFTGMASLLLAG